MTASLELHRDYQDMLTALTLAGVDYLVIGGFAVAAHGFVRVTKDLDVLVRPSRENARRVVEALDRFGAPRRDASEADFSSEGTIFQIGVAPRRIDVLTSTAALSFDDAKRAHLEVKVGDLAVPVIGLQALLTTKRAVGRPEDKKDVRELERIHGLKAPTSARRRSRPGAARKTSDKTAPKRRR